MIKLTTALSKIRSNQIHYNAALYITGAMRGSSRKKMYQKVS